MGRKRQVSWNIINVGGARGGGKEGNLHRMGKSPTTKEGLQFED